MKQTLLFFAILFYAVSFSQIIKFDGTILDAGKKPVEMANVIAINMGTKNMDAYGITNGKGKFQLSLNGNATYEVSVSFIGYKTNIITIVTSGENIVRTITLEQGAVELEGVEIVREMPVSIKGDTIVYNADSFKSGTEKKLEDILKKLPGVQVDANGGVTVEGKSVSKLMVEGKDFFDGDTKLGVKNIPADAIDKVQVLRNYSDIGALKNLENNSENVAMNIKLKEGKKNFWFGDMTAGAGVAREDGRYVVNPKLFYYSPKYSVNIIGNLNNIGELPLTAQDYFNFTGGFRNFMKKGGSNFNVATNDLGISLMQNNQAKNIETKFGATNFSYNITKAWRLSGFGIASSTNNDLETKTQNTILANGNKQNSYSLAHQKTNLGLFKFSSSYKPSEKFQFDYDLLAKRSQQDENSDLLRQSIVSNVSTSETINTLKQQNPTTINQNLGLYYTQSDKNVFVFEMQHLYQDESPFYNANLMTQPFNLTGYVPGQQRNDISQSRFVKTNKVDTKLDYYYMLTPKSNINLTLGNTNSFQNFNSNIFQILDNGNRNDLTAPENNNIVTYKFNDNFVGLHVKMLTGKFTFTPGVSYHGFTMDNGQLGSNYTKQFNRFLPDFYALYQIKKSETLTYTFSYNNNFTDINQLIGGYLFSSYNSLFRGNRYLESATSQMHSIRYFKFNMYNMENISGNISYTRNINAVKTNAVFDGVNQTSTPYNSNFADETASGFGSYGRSFLRFYKSSISGNLNYSKFHNITNNKPTITESYTQNYTLKASTNYKSLPNLEVGYTLTVNNYSQSTYYTKQPFVKVDYFFLKRFSFVSDYNFYHYYNSAATVNNRYDFLNASLIYQNPGSKLEYKLGATNVLNTKIINNDSFSQLSTTVSQYTVMPRYVVFRLTYNL